MADNTTLSAAVGTGDVIATDDLTTLNGGAVTGVKVQRMKVGFGSDASLRDVDSSNPLPVVQTGTPTLPTGASTAAKQPALGTAGTASTDVLTVQGITSMTPLKVDGSGVTQPVSGTVTSNIGTTNGLALDATLTGGTQRTKLTDGTNNAAVKAASTAAAATDPAVVVAISPNNTVPVSLATAPTTPVTGTFWQATQPVSGTVTANQGGTWTVQPGNTANTTAWKVDGSAVTQPVSLATNTPTLQTGSNVIGKVSIDQTTPGTTNFVAANLTQINGTAISSSNPLPTTQYTTTGNGFTSSHYISAASTNATNVKASAGDIGGIQAYNNTGTIGYLKIYDKASSPTVGTDVPIKTILIPANTSGAGTNISFASPGISCSSGISFAITGGIADADTTAVAANAFVINLDTK